MALAYAKETSEPEQRRIREIRVDIGLIHPEDEAKESAFARFQNRYHIATRESVIRTNLLFKEGDVLDQDLIESSERGLRRFRFLNAAEIEVVPVDEKTVDIEVRTRDAWSLVPGGNVQGGGGLAVVSLSLMEVNLLGQGKTLFAEAINESDVGTTWKYGYRDYQLFGSRWTSNLTYQTGPLIESYYLHAGLPLYSPDSKWAGGVSAFQGDIVVRRFEDGEESDRFAKDQKFVTGFIKRSFGERFKKHNVKLQLKYETIDYSSLGIATSVPPPPDTANLTPIVAVTTQNIEWVKETYINKMGIVEDKTLGLRSGIRVGYGIPLENGFELWDTRVFASYTSEFANDQFAFINAAVDSEVVRNTIVFGGAKYYKKFSRHTVAFRFSTKLGYELDTSRQFNLGADSGLRGYKARQFTGEKLVVLNLEDRQFWGEQAGGLNLAIGTVLFVDAGNVWKEEEDVDLGELNWSTGFGFRIGFSNLPGQPIARIDYGWALDGSGESALTVGMEQHF